ncbi:hypothetical protein B9Z55_012163 [Caenorhabditis nigoni]|uniref:Nuclear receptor domain-containing protein n=1 Tax=Caenorhabditis nigoni TaxID=1611254 RepID=A0A2G5TWI5_9PELO|nr:hypothetical protein B9Z55_012163 [Caenorhabditis nigoni]
MDQKVCVVCGAISKIKVFGVDVCKACKEFFTKNDGIVLHCVKGNNRCEISRNNQKKCGYCRMKKCLEVGMKATEIALDSKELEQDQKAEKITQIIEEFKETQALVRQQNFEGVQISLFITQPSIGPFIHRLNAWQVFSSHMDQEILKIIYFSKSILSLDQITPQDQLALTKKSIFKMYLLHVVPAISSKGLVLGTGRIIDLKSLELLFGNQLAKKILEFSEDVKILSFNKENLVHVIAFILMPKSQEVKNLISGTIGDLIYIQTKLEYLDRIFRGSVLPWVRENQKWIKLPEIFVEIFEI